MRSITQQPASNEWDAFVKRQTYSPMTQSSAYGEFYASTGEHSSVFIAREGDIILGGALVLTVHAKRGNFLFIPYGPILEENDFSIIKELIENIVLYAKEKKFDFIRISPFLDNTTELQQFFTQELCVHQSPLHTLAETTWLLDVRPNTIELLKSMNKNHRNLIRRCEREGVSIQISHDLSSLTDFNTLHDTTAKRHKFVRFSDDYIRKEFAAFNTNGNVCVFKAFLPDGRLDSAAIVYYYGNSAAYRHGASLLQDKKLPTSYLLQWHAIQEAQKRGITYYNFWGIAPDKAPDSHPFKGITHFKKGFGGFQKDLLPSHDLPLRNKYYFTKIIEKLRKFKRGF